MTVSDPAGIARTSLTDGLGRLQTVLEYPALPSLDSHGCVIGTPSNYSTAYTYDALNDLTGVNQSGLTRTFAYDWLGRLTSAANPESGTVNYTSYDGNGNLLTKSDARGVQTTMTYDTALNRILSKTYNDGPPSTPTVTYTYDDLVNSKGHLTKVSSSSSTWQILTFDVLGRPTSSNQTTGTVNPGNFAYTYNLADKLTSETYPSNRTITTFYDLAGRPSCVSATTNCTATSYASSVSYASHGDLASMMLGNGLIDSRTYNNRLQPTQIAVGSLLTLGYGFGTTGNNGNVLSQTIAGNGVPSLTQNYTYDSLNRIGTFTETGNQSNQTYGYDAWGNRWVSSGWIPYSGQTPTSNTFSSNRWNGAVHDASGNQTSITGLSRGFTYDAENRQGSATINTTTTNYLYDGDGRRVQKNVQGLVTTFVYDALGQLAAEYGGPAPTVTGTTYLTSDHLGSTRLVTGASQNIVERCDYAPFGEELGQGLDGRTSTASYCNNGYPTATPDATELKFTSKERDAETGLDFFGARYYSSAQGRFTSPDEWAGGIVDPLTGGQVGTPGPLPYADITDPQTLNKYAYVRNNPLRYIDPDGHDITFASPGLEDLYNRLATESPTFATELAADREPNPNFTVNVVERGLRQNDEKSSGDATATRTGSQVSITVYIDSHNRTSDSTVAHEQGHVKDARTNTNQFFKDGLATKKAKGSPGALAHNDRPEEKRADQFRDQFNKDQKAYQKAQKEQRRQEQQRKKKKDEPQ